MGLYRMSHDEKGCTRYLGGSGGVADAGGCRKRGTPAGGKSTACAVGATHPMFLLNVTRTCTTVSSDYLPGEAVRCLPLCAKVLSSWRHVLRIFRLNRTPDRSTAQTAPKK